MTESGRDASLHGKVAIVTGASGGIGGALARQLADREMFILATGRSVERLTKLQEEIGPERFQFVTADFRWTDQIDALADRLLDLVAERGVRVLASVAGCHIGGEVDELAANDLAALELVNVEAPKRLTSAMASSLTTGLGGDLVIVNSSASGSTRQEHQAFAMSKRRLLAWTNDTRGRLGPEGVRVLSVFPGRTDTATWDQILREQGARRDVERLLQPEDVAATILAAVTMPEHAEITDVHLRPRRAPR